MVNALSTLESDIVINSVHCWTDSQISSAWICSISRESKSYATSIQEDSPLTEGIKKDEKKKSCVNTVLENYSIAKIIDVNKFNDVLKLFRVTAFVLRFINNMMKKNKKKDIILKLHITTIKMSEAKLIWLRYNQSQFKKR